jgi:archaellum component FlaD/FlaE
VFKKKIRTYKSIPWISYKTKRKILSHIRGKLSRLDRGMLPINPYIRIRL